MSIDLKWRPESYSDFHDPVALALNGIQGQMRREMVRDMLTAEGEHREFCDNVLGSIEPNILKERADEQFIYHMSNFDSPVWMGGEYLPEVSPGEVEIARIVLPLSTLGDVISVRARLRSGRYRYRVVDEYQSEFHIRRKSSIRPLTLGQLIDLIQTGSQPGFTHDGNGLVEGFWNVELEDGAGPGALEECVRFAHVESDHYPELAAWYEERGRQWRIERVRDRMEECSFCGGDYDPCEEDHECEEGKAWCKRREEERKREEEEHERREQEWDLHPMANEIQEMMQTWWTTSAGGISGAGGLCYQHARAKLGIVEQLIRDTLLTTGVMPSGVYTLEYGFINPEPMSLTVDFDRLADEAKVIPKRCVGLDEHRPRHRRGYRIVARPKP